MFFLLLFLTREFIDSSEYVHNNRENIILESSNDSDPPPNSKYAFVTSYTGESEKSYNFLQCIITLGGMLKTVSPEYDRILLIPKKVQINSEIIEILSKIWTHIIYRKYIYSYRINIEPSDVYLFKIQAWTLKQYEKVLYIGADVLPLNDLSSIFQMNAPCAAIDLYKYKMNRYTSYINTDFILFHPCDYDFAGLVNEIINTHFNYDNNTPDALIINKYMNDRLSLLPLKSVIECIGGEKSTILNEEKLNGTLDALAIHFGHKSKPWLSNSPIGELWMLFSSNINEQYHIPSKYTTIFDSDINSRSVDMFFQAFKDKYSLINQSVECNEEAKEKTQNKEEEKCFSKRDYLSFAMFALFSFSFLYVLIK